MAFFKTLKNILNTDIRDILKIRKVDYSKLNQTNKKVMNIEKIEKDVSYGMNLYSVLRNHQINPVQLKKIINRSKNIDPILKGYALSDLNKNRYYFNNYVKNNYHINKLAPIWMDGSKTAEGISHIAGVKPEEKNVFKYELNKQILKTTNEKDAINQFIRSDFEIANKILTENGEKVPRLNDSITDDMKIEAHKVINIKEKRPDKYLFIPNYSKVEVLNDIESYWGKTTLSSILKAKKDMNKKSLISWAYNFHQLLENKSYDQTYKTLQETFYKEISGIFSRNKITTNSQAYKKHIINGSLMFKDNNMSGQKFLNFIDRINDHKIESYIDNKEIYKTNKYRTQSNYKTKPLELMVRNVA